MTAERAMVSPAQLSDDYDRARERVSQSVIDHLDAWAKASGLIRKNARFKAFAVDVTEALHDCLRAHIASAWGRYKRAAGLRTDFLLLADAATAAVEKLRELQKTYDTLLPTVRSDPVFRLPFSLAQIIAELEGTKQTGGSIEGLASVARRIANADVGGPSRQRIFEELIEGLMRAYQQAIGHKGTGHDVDEARLLDLVEAVLPVVRETADEVTGEPLWAPDALREYLLRAAQRRDW